MTQASGGRLRHGEEYLWLLPVALVSAGLFALAGIAGAAHGVSATRILSDYATHATRALPLLAQLAVLGLLVRALLTRSASPLRRILDPVRRAFASPMLAAAALAPLAIMPLLFAGFGLLKMLTPLYVPFLWDDAFAAADRALFFGYQPWTFTHALLGGQTATAVVDRLYTGWVPLLSFAMLGFALLAPRYDRARFFLAFTAAWALLGVAGAWLGASAGPCYTPLIGASSAPEFAPMMERLHAYAATVHLDAVRWQGVLWEAHVERHYAFGLGISAMPSLHNAVAVLYALALARFGRAAAAAGWLFAGIVFVGSIHLGWHYAVDGLIAGAAMYGLWRAAGWYLERTGYAAAVAVPAEPVADPRPLPA